MRTRSECPRCSVYLEEERAVFKSLSHYFSQTYREQRRRTIERKAQTPCLHCEKSA